MRKKKLKHPVAKPIFIIIGFFAVTFGLVFWTQSPLLVELRHSFVYNLVIKIVFTAALFVLAFVPFFKVPLYGKIFLIFDAALLWIVWFLTARVSVSIVFFSAAVQLIADLVCYLLFERARRAKEKRRLKKPAMAQVVVSALMLISGALTVLEVDYIYAEFPFWLPALIASGLAAAVTLWFSWKKGVWFKQKQNRIWAPLCALLFVFIGVWMSANVLNYSLDTARPRSVQAQVLEKDIRTGPRSPTTYEFKILVEGEDKPRTLNVPQYVYYHTEEADSILIYVYPGAFHEPYYIWE